MSSISFVSIKGKISLINPKTRPTDTKLFNVTQSRHLKYRMLKLQLGVLTVLEYRFILLAIVHWYVYVLNMISSLTKGTAG